MVEPAIEPIRLTAITGRRAGLRSPPQIRRTRRASTSGGYGRGEARRASNPPSTNSSSPAIPNTRDGTQPREPPLDAPPSETLACEYEVVKCVAAARIPIE